MECTGRITNIGTDWQTGKFHLTFEVNERSIASQLDEVKDVEKLTIKAVKFKQKRSLDANAYCWTLLHKMAGKSGQSAEDLYRGYIKDFGVCEIMPVRIDSIERWCSSWGSKGYGWLTEDMGECRTIKGYHNIKCFYGSSSYTTQEMSQLIDAIVQDCKDLGIDTATPEDIERMKALWGEKNE